MQQEQHGNNEDISTFPLTVGNLCIALTNMVKHAGFEYFLYEVGPLKCLEQHGENEDFSTFCMKWVL